ncbi:hypothetical protein A1Q1_01950 [Trichosporon asahii var. asahii CBS 2479]|uniref:Uncharacterized protein n=1 Tax=Trichosporon asahii var. asahii (strain ATCC 90039 / CBS 2479 / JCM 2466 / KCTC 7840 / NBRC 103889/ NCYC 2677 / UAMH 7654) TaxID=1186058 RepID=J5T3G4_TRIAS|nr:hypothetical protein A1Q1_01950 [Trichosporon asahii var. asahii CBS 2479]EJT48961.1 hypothetical protein A1Q1_01950 [Trichosporon asahii var. asahii CBS 2479]
MSTSLFGSSLFTRKPRSLNRDRKMDKLPPTADHFPTVTSGTGGPAFGRVRPRPSVLQVRYAHSHRTQTSFLPDLDVTEASTAESCDSISFLPFGELERLLPRKPSVVSASTNTLCTPAHDTQRANLAPAPSGLRRVIPEATRNTGPTRTGSCVWNTTRHPLPSCSLSVDDPRPSFASEPGPLLYYGPRNEAQPRWTPRSSGDGETLHPVMSVTSCELPGREWHDAIQEEDSDGSESPLAPLDALEGFCNDDATSEDEGRLARDPLPSLARGYNVRHASSVWPRSSSQTALRQSQVMRPLASRNRKLSGASRSSRSSVGSAQGNRATTQADSQSPCLPSARPDQLSVPIHLGPLPPLPESSCERSNDYSTRYSSLAETDRRWSAELDTSASSFSALGLNLSGTATWVHDLDTSAGASYIIPPEERSRITAVTSEVKARSARSLSSASHSDDSLDTLLVPASPGGMSQSPTPLPTSPFLCPTTPVGLCPPPRRKHDTSHSDTL